jgi:type II secretory pathway component GspD/PulD (secretin)
MSAQGVPVVVSGDVTGALSGRFQKMQAQDVFEQIISTYNLVWYYDTHTLYVYNSDEMQTGTIKLQALTVAEFRQSLKDLGIFDVRFSWQASEPDGLIFFSGPQRYVTLVMEMAEVLDSQRNRLTVYRWKDNDGVTNFSTASPGSHQNQVAIINLERTEIEPSKTFIQVSHNHQIEAEKESSLLVPVE